jgi:replicative DNA helicase
MPDTPPKLPPHSRDAEQCVLGSMLRDNGVIADVLRTLGAEDFYTDAHQRIFRTIVALFDSGRPVDAVLLAEELKSRKAIEDIGGYVYLGELLAQAPTSANAEHYARIVRDKAIIRALIHAANQILRDAQGETGPPEHLLQTAERLIFDIAQRGCIAADVMIRESVQAVWDRIDERARRGAGAITGLSTGFLDLDDKLAGLQPSHLIVIAARPSIGKTAIGLALARHVAADLGRAVFFVGLEQPHIDLTERLMCREAMVDGHRLRRGIVDDADAMKLSDAGKALMPVPIIYATTAGLGMLHIAAAARRHKLRHDIALVVVDYLGLVEPDNRRENRNEQVAGISLRLKRLAGELNIPVIALAQLNRAVEGRADPTPRLSDLRDSGAIEQDADEVLLLHRPDESRQQIEVIVAKNRNGPTGQVTLVFDRIHQRFENAPAFI